MQADYGKSSREKATRNISASVSNDMAQSYMAHGADRTQLQATLEGPGTKRFEGDIR